MRWILSAEGRERPHLRGPTTPKKMRERPAAVVTAAPRLAALRSELAAVAAARASPRAGTTTRRRPPLRPTDREPPCHNTPPPSSFTDATSDRLIIDSVAEASRARGSAEYATRAAPPISEGAECDCAVGTYDACLLTRLPAFLEDIIAGSGLLGSCDLASPTLTAAEWAFAAPGGSRRTVTPPYPDLVVLS